MHQPLSFRCLSLRTVSSVAPRPRSPCPPGKHHHGKAIVPRGDSTCTAVPPNPSALPPSLEVPAEEGREAVQLVAQQLKMWDNNRV